MVRGQWFQHRIANYHVRDRVKRQTLVNRQVLLNCISHCETKFHCESKIYFQDSRKYFRIRKQTEISSTFILCLFRNVLACSKDYVTSEKESNVLTVTRALRKQKGRPFSGEVPFDSPRSGQRTLHLYDYAANTIIAVDRSSKNNTDEGYRNTRIEPLKTITLILVDIITSTRGIREQKVDESKV